GAVRGIIGGVFSRGAAADGSQGRKPLVSDVETGPSPGGAAERQPTGALCRPSGAGGTLVDQTRGLRPWLTSAAAPRLKTKTPGCRRAVGARARPPVSC